MIDKESSITYNNKYLLIMENDDGVLVDGFVYTFQYVIEMHDTFASLDETFKFINNNNFSHLILVDYIDKYNELINKLGNSYKISFIFTKSLSSLSNKHHYSMLFKILELYKKKKVFSVGFLDKSIYLTFSNVYKNIYYILLDIPESINKKNQINDESIGILSNLELATHSSFNSISAVKLLNKELIIFKINKKTKKFLDLFNIDYKEKNSDNFYHNEINLYVNFTDNNPLLFFKSMDQGNACIVGNNAFLNEELNELLAIKSDDDINEIKDKINFVHNNYQMIMGKYKEFRKEYSKNSKLLVSKFLNIELHNRENIIYEKVLTIVVPVYNTRNYLEKCLNSVVKAMIPNSEILIINDGSTDDSEEIIKKYLNRYPNLVRYIKQENHGLGNVRNVALRESKGKYISSIDSDDSININFFKEAKFYMEKNVDVIIYDWLSIIDNKRIQTPAIEKVFNNINTYKGLLYSSIMPSTCNKIIKKSIFKEMKIEYLEDKYEDLSVNPFILLRANTIKYINKPYYEYFIRENSLMRTNPGYSMINVLKDFTIKLKRYQNIVNVPYDEFKFYTYSWRIEEYVFNQLYDLEEKYLKDFIDYLYTNIYDIICEVFSLKEYIDVINNLKNKENSEYIIERNKKFSEKKLLSFIVNAKKNKKYFKLTPSIIYFGE